MGSKSKGKASSNSVTTVNTEFNPSLKITTGSVPEPSSLTRSLQAVFDRFDSIPATVSLPRSTPQISVVSLPASTQPATPATPTVTKLKPATVSVLIGAGLVLLTKR